MEICQRFTERFTKNVLSTGQSNIQSKIITMLSVRTFCFSAMLQEAGTFITLSSTSQHERNLQL